MDYELLIFTVLFHCQRQLPGGQKQKKANKKILFLIGFRIRDWNRKLNLLQNVKINKIIFVCALIFNQ